MAFPIDDVLADMVDTLAADGGAGSVQSVIGTDGGGNRKIYVGMPPQNVQTNYARFEVISDATLGTFGTTGEVGEIIAQFSAFFDIFGASGGRTNLYVLQGRAYDLLHDTQPTTSGGQVYNVQAVGPGVVEFEDEEIDRLRMDFRVWI